MALDALSDAEKASNKAALDKTREIINDTFRGEVAAISPPTSPMAYNYNTPKSTKRAI